MIKLHQYLIVLLLCCQELSCFAQNNYTISGYIRDGQSGEDLIGATVYVVEVGKGTTTNMYGFYSITLPEGTYTIRTSYIGFDNQTDTINLIQNTPHNINLGNAGIEMQEVVIEDERTDENVDGTQMGTIELEIDKIKTLPAFMGEVDILKTIQLLPGVQSAGEGNTGFYVRGGGPDQNLILLDGATVYNASHLFGFFSVFNADAVKNMELIKGGMPANYGGRLASVLDISMKEGNLKEYQFDGGIGLISSRFTAQGPIKKDTASFIISGRRTYIDVLMQPLIKDDSPFKGSGYFFYDLNAKVNWRLSQKDRLYMSAYFGRDVFSYNNSESGFNIRIPWGNATTTARWNHLFGEKLFMNTTAIFSDYQFSFESVIDQFEFKLNSGIRDLGLKVDFNYYPNIRHSVKFGANYTYHTFTPSSVTAKSGETEFDTGDIQKIFAHEAGVYLLDEFDITDQLKVNLGFRLSFFQHVGPFDRYIKNETNPSRTDTIIHYGGGDVIKTYWGPEPRIAMRYSINSRISLKASYTHNYQYVHLSSISAISMPTDIWFPSTELVAPQIGDQYSIGYFQNFANNEYEASVELYYKDLSNLIEYKDGAQPDATVNDNVDNQLVFGTGYSYGAEFFLKKRHGQLNGWIGYTWSKTMREFDDLELALGEPFPAKYDRRHDLSVVAQYDLNDFWTFGAVFVYATGSTMTPPSEIYFFENEMKINYGQKNSYRMPSYHRADISATYNGKTTKVNKDLTTGEEIVRPKKVYSSWNFSVYNVYNRANPYFIYIDNEGDLEEGTLDATAKQVSIFPVLPSITWNFKF